jgi:hypothetical protein
MDRHGSKSVTLTSPEGRIIGALPLEGAGLPESAAATGVFVDGSEVYAEREHGDLVHLGSTSGTASRERESLPGRPTRDGAGFISAGIVKATDGTVTLTFIERAHQRHRYTRQYGFGGAIDVLTLLDTDAQGIIYLAARRSAAAPATGAAMGPELLILCIEPAGGRVVGEKRAPASVLPDETFRELSVRPQGGVVYLHRTETHAQVLDLSCSD